MIEAGSSALEYLGAETLAELVPPADAVSAIEAELRAGLDPESDVPRVISPLAHGEFLLMPSQTARFAGVKIATVAPGNPALGRPKIQGTYLLFDAETLTPLAAMDGAKLTLIRTPAVTVTAIKHMLLAGPAGNLRVDRLVIFGTSVQAWHHLRTLAAICTLDEVVLIGRRPAAAEDLARRSRAAGFHAHSGTETDIDAADVVICATSSSTAVFDGARVKPGCVIAAIGSHGLGSREIDETLARRADVVVEARSSAMCEAGDLIPARPASEWAQHRLTNLAELVGGQFRRRADAPALYTAVGMSWEDLVIAAQAYTARLRGS